MPIFVAIRQFGQNITCKNSQVGGGMKISQVENQYLIALAIGNIVGVTASVVHCSFTRDS